MKRILSCIIYLLAAWNLYAQQKMISGSIKDSESGNPIEGVNIQSTFANTRSVSGPTGRFRIAVAEKDTLLFTSVNYNVLTMPVRSSSQVVYVTMTNKNTILGDVIVHTGYQAIPRERSTGSFIQVDNKLLNRANSPHILDRLNGVTNSLLFDNNPSHPPFTIRGLGTLTNSTDVASPLIVLDNFPYEGDINNIDPNDVESVTILRDAAAASIWGAKAGNGVIVINTKQSHYNQPFHLSVNSSVSVSKKPDLFAVSQMTTSDFIDVEQFLFDKGFYDADLTDTQNWPVISPVVTLLDSVRKSLLTPGEANKKIDALRNKDVRNEYLSYFYRQAMQQQYAINLSGGKENMAWLTSLGYDNNLGSLQGDKDNRTTWRSQVSAKPLKRLSIQTGMLSTWTKNYNNSPLPLSIASGKSVYPYAAIADNSGNSLILPKNYRNSFKDTAGNGNLLDWGYRPLDELHFGDNSSETKGLLLNFEARYFISHNLTAEIKYQYEDDKTANSNYHSQQTYLTRNLINLFTNFEGGTLTRAIPLGGIIDLGNYETVSHAGRVQLDYNRTLGKRHTISGIVGGEIRQSKTSGSAYRTYGYNDDNLTSANVNFNDRYPILDGLSFSPTIPNYTDFAGHLNRILSIYANGSYTYDKRYTISASARKDASNILGVSTNNKWKPLWSAGAAWKLSRESFYHSSWLPSVKLRLTYGFSGNVNNSLPAVTTLDYTSLNYSGISNLPFATVANPPNTDLRWEKIGILNAAVDFATKNNFINGSIEYYVKKSTDVISAVPVDITLYGQASLLKNSASLKGQGIDVTLNANIIDRRLKWELSLIYSYDKVSVTKYLLPFDAHNAVGEGGNILPVAGQNPYNVISYKCGGLNADNGNPIGYLNKNISEDYSSIIASATWDDLVISGSAVPVYYGAVRNTFSYHHFALSFNITFKGGYYFRKSTINYTNLYGSWIGNGDFEKRWQKPGDEKHTRVPSMIYPADYYRDLFYQESEATVEKGDVIRLQDINVIYDLSPRHTIKSPVFHIYFNVNNPGIIWRANKDGIDPDVNNNVPVPPVLSLGCKIDI